MEIAAAADEQSVTGGQGTHLPFFGRRVSAVYGFQPYEAVFCQLPGEPVQSCGAHGVERRVGEYGNTAVFQNQLHCLDGRHLFPGNKTGAVVAHIPVKSFFQVPRVTVTQHIFGIMGPGDHRVGEFGQQILVGDRNSCLLQQPAHFPVSGNPGVHEFLQPLPESGMMIINVQAYNVDVMALVFRGKLNAGYDFGNPPAVRILTEGIFLPVPDGFRISYGFVQPVHCVMVRECECLQPLFHGIIHKLRWSQTAVGAAGMYM